MAHRPHGVRSESHAGTFQSRNLSHIPAIGEPSDLKQSLDGEWRVEMVQASDIDLEEEPFAAEDFDDSAFGRIDVPSTCRTRDT